MDDLHRPLSALHCLLHVSVLLCCGVHSPRGNNEHEAIRQQSWSRSLKSVPEMHILVRPVHSYWEQKVPDFGFCEPLCLHHSLTPPPKKKTQKNLQVYN